jgi:benzoyl-CoA reductase/2-hydroxyglutaryl-CoA dehydratase subunit BcrC/BadD/HgdB
MMKYVGISSTVPIEILMAAGYTPVDLNNAFITSANPEKYINVAERAGFPLNSCAWIKGIYGVVMQGGLDKIICVTTGDCSNTVMLMEVLKMRKPDVLSFAFPDKPDRRLMNSALKKLAAEFGTTVEAAEKVREQLAGVRQLVTKLDEMTWKDNKVTGFENHYWLVSSSDFNSDINVFRSQVQALLEEASNREAYPKTLRIAYIGVPPVFARELYPYLEANGAHVVYNEIQRQFTMPADGISLAEQYTKYTYPYSIYGRLKDIKAETKRRRVDGIIHYIQAFCHRGIGDIIFRESLDLPVLTIEGNQEFLLTQHSRTRIEAFLDMIKRWKRNK